MNKISTLRFVLLISLLLPGVSGAAPGDAVVVNSTTAGDQVGGVIARAPNGTFFVAWESADSDGTGIFGRRLDATGNPDGSEVALNTVTTGEQTRPAITALSDGRYIVVWQGAGATEVRGRLVNADGTTVGAELLLSNLAPDIEPTVVPDDVGGFLVFWSDSTSIYSRHFDNTGAPGAAEITLTGAPTVPAFRREEYAGLCVVALDNGNYLMVWESNDRAFGQLIDDDGVAIAVPFRLDATEVTQRMPAVASTTGGALLAWRDFSANDLLRTRRIANDGTFINTPQPIAFENGFSFSLVATSSGFLLAYPERWIDGNLPQAAQVLAQALDSNGIATGNAARISTEVSMEGGPFADLRYRYFKSKIVEMNNDALLTLWASDPDAWDVTARQLPGFRISRLEHLCGNDGKPVGVEIQIEETGSTDPVTLDAPMGYSFSVNPVVPPATTILTGPAFASGKYRLTLSGDNGTSVDSGSVTFLVLDYSTTADAPIGELAPIAPDLNWRFNELIPLEDLWNVEIATDAGFTNIVDEGTVPGNYDPVRIFEPFGTFRTQTLLPGTQYFWRARAADACGIPGDWSPTVSLSTANDLVLAEESKYHSPLYDSRLELIGTPDVAPAQDPGTFIISYAAYSYQFLNDLELGWNISYTDFLAPQGQQSVRREAMQPPENVSGQELIESPVVADDNDFLVVWGGTREIVSQRLDTDGQSSGSPQQLSTADNRPAYPDVAANDSGEKIVVWSDRLGTPRIAGQRIASDGTPIGHVFQVDDGPHLTDRPSIAWSPVRQEFLVTWESLGSGGTDGDGWSVQGKRLGPDGAALGSDFQINTLTTSDQRHPEVVVLNNGEDFFVVWHSNATNGDDVSGTSIQGVRVDGSGPVGTETQLNSFTTGNQKDPALAVEPKWGGILVTWKSNGSPGDDSDGSTILARYLDNDLQPIDAEFQVNQLTAGDQFGARVAAHPGSDEFMIVWKDATRVLGKRIETQPLSFSDGFESGDTSAWSAVISP